MATSPTKLPVLPLKNTVVYPQVVVPLAVGRSMSIAAVNAALERGRELVAVAQRDQEEQRPERAGLYDVGTVVTISRVEKRDQGLQVIVQGLRRVRLGEAHWHDEQLLVATEPLPALTMNEPEDDAAAVDALVRENLTLAQTIAELFDQENGSQIYQQLVGSLPDSISQMYRIASLASLELEQEQLVLECDTALALMQELHKILRHEQKVTELRRQIAEQTRQDMDSQQREHLLRQQKRAIEQALGEDDGDDDVAELKADLERARPPEAVSKEVDRELRRLARMSPNAADYQVTRAYLELVAELPWHQHTEDQLDLTHAQQVLDEDHYGLEEVKSRILESLAVLKLNPGAPAPILCLVGPPGVGKTSLGQSIARAMGRKFERISLGGLHDEGELRGHRRTYIGAMPGRIIQGIRRAGVVNPVLMLDEIDKLGRDFRGDPSAALMEILDPAQNKDFRDNYLNLPYDLSRVFFITTANTLDGISRPLLDRMEVLELSGYSDMEKRAIARRYLIPRQRKQVGLADDQLEIDDAALDLVIRRYTREAGVRELERVFGQLGRKRARQVVAGQDLELGIDPDTVRELLGPEKFKHERYREALVPGVAAGLAWTEAGGDVLYVEAALTQKDDKIILTGHLGQVMQESARAARSYIWTVAEQLNIDRSAIESHGVHFHVPEGAVPKDGPSAGVTMATALVSAYRYRPMRTDVAMTGELTLTGLVLPVGGIKEKVLAAHRSGFRHVILPRENQADLAKLPDEVRADMTFTLADHLDQVLDAAFDRT
jgi:ATP-dependent Lon protease